MIVNQIQDGWEVIYQRSHGLLAALMVASWQHKYHTFRWTETLVAIAQHDDQENFWGETQHLSEQGAPLHFTNVGLDTEKIQARYVIQNAMRQSLWVALLISRHNSFLYETKRGQDSELDEFLDEQIKNQKIWQKELKLTKQEVDSAYALVQWGDRLSLILCCRELPDRERAVEICMMPDGERHEVKQHSDGTIQLTPWRLDTDKITYSVETRRLHQLQFKNEEDFRCQLEAAPIEIVEWEFVK